MSTHPYGNVCYAAEPDNSQPWWLKKTFFFLASYQLPAPGKTMPTPSRQLGHFCQSFLDGFHNIVFLMLPSSFQAPAPA